MMRKPALAYRQFSVQGATPLGLVVMLYDGAITFLQRAVAAMEASDTGKKCEHLKRVLAIMAQLEGTLNFQQGGEAARTLKAFYLHARAQATKANLENSVEILRSLIEEFTTVRDAWREGERRLATLSTTHTELLHTQTAAAKIAERRLDNQTATPLTTERRLPPRHKSSPVKYASAEENSDETVGLSIFD
jgi:flagellar protein FliS